MKLELRHLAPYLPYKLMIYDTEDCEIFDLVMCSESEIYLSEFESSYETAKPILKPLSELTKDDFKEELYQYYQTLGIDVKLVNYDSGNDNPFDMTLTVTYKMMGEVYTDCLINRGSTSETPYHIIVWLCENHFDIFGLIKDGLALDINDLSLADA
ncbi:MAG TPA: hypothetical protein VFM70_10730 [Salinimicrobium sp.]|nr:hypothetical protein [Salinimicrobium sp.]